MRTQQKTRRIRGQAFVITAALAVSVSACGESDFKNQPRPPVSVELTGVIKKDKVTISPSKVGAGPILITISNQTDQSHTVSLRLAGQKHGDDVGPVNPLDTATIQKTVKSGTYEVIAGSPKALSHEPDPATLTIGPQRRNSNDRLLQP
jgi:hypothetical protein